LGRQEAPGLGGASAARAVALVAVLVSSVLIAVFPNFSKLAYQAGASVPLVIVGRFFVTVLLLSLVLAYRRCSLLTSMRVLRLCLIGGIATAAMSFGILAAITRIEISLVVLIVYLHPVLVAWIGHVRGNYVLTRFRLGCCVIFLIGLALALSVSFGRLDPVGMALAFVGTCGATVLLITNGEAVGEGGTVIVNFYTAVAALVPACIVATVVGPLNLPGTGTGWLAILGTGASFCLALALFFAAVPLIGLVRATLISALEPLFAILLAMALFGERLAALQWLGVVLVLAGILMLEIPPEQTNRLLGMARR
jgi:drug/metabolite transporter (DMT)-like permease